MAGGLYMDKKFLIGVSLLFTLVVIGVVSIFLYSKSYKKEINKVEATVLYMTESTVTVQDSNHIIYTMSVDNMDVLVGDNVLIEYKGLLDRNRENQDVSIIHYSVLNKESEIPSEWLDDGIFSDYYKLAYNKLQTLTLDEKIGQLFLVRYLDSSAIADLNEYKFGGFVFFEKDFKNKTKDEVVQMIDSLQDVSMIPLLTAVDEEGGKVVRVSSNPKLVDIPFKSSKELYEKGGFELIYQDTKEKSVLLKSLGLNLNLAPVVDISTNPNDYIYERTLGKDVSLTSKYVMAVIDGSKGTGVSYTLKHFPGYGSNSDTHLGTSIDTRTYDEIINNDLKPFEAGIGEGAEAILVSHNIVNAIDPDNPASLSASIHNLLRNQLSFTGIVITDDLSMNAVDIEDVAVKAILSGNDLIISTNYVRDIQSVKSAISNGKISEAMIDKLAFRVLAWKYSKGLMFIGK